MSNSWYRPPPAPLDLPTPTYDDRPRSFPDFPAPDLFPLQLPVVQHSPLASPSATSGSQYSPPESPGPPLKGLATKFAQMMGRGASPVPPPSFGTAEPPLAPPAPVGRPGHGYSKSVGQPASTYWDQPDERGLSGDEIERLAREERDWSRREAERLMALENQRLAAGKRSTVATPEAEERTPRKAVAARANSYFDASSTPPGAVAARPAAPSAAPAPASSTALARAVSQTSSLPELPAQKSAYLLPHASDPEALDVPASLVLLARKFEKLEVYSVTHLRTLSARMAELEGRVAALEGGREVAVGQVRKEMRELRLAMAEGFQALEGEIEDVSRRGRDGFGLGMGLVEQPHRRELHEEPRSMTDEPESVLPGLLSSSSASSITSSHTRLLKTPSPSLAAGVFPVDTTPLAVSKSPSTANLEAPSAASASSGGRASPSSPGGSPVPPRKRYTALLASRADSPVVASSPSSVADILPSLEQQQPQQQSHSTPLPSAPFPPGRRAQTAAPTSTRPLFVKSRNAPSPAPLSTSTTAAELPSAAAAAAVDSPTRRRARSVGSVLSASSATATGGEADTEPVVGGGGAEKKKVFGEDVKASNRGRAPVNKLISAWERK